MEKQIQYVADYEIRYSDVELDNLELQLSQQEELQLAELIELRKKADAKSSFLKDMLEAAKQGALNYLDSFTDTGETFDEMKNSDNIRRWDDTEINIKDNSAERHDPLKTRTMSEAKANPFDNNVSGSTTGMSSDGIRRFEQYKEAYTQRTKSVTKMSTEDSTINRSDPQQNFESLSGLRGYRIGPVVEMPTYSAAKSGYEQYKTQKIADGAESTILSESRWLYNENMKAFDTRLMKEFGFNTPSEAAAWRKENHLTVHEGPDGMFLVPRDVHDSVSHGGYRTKMTEALKGKITKEELDDYIRQEKIEFAWHEAKIRSVRTIKGVGMSMVRDLLKNFIFIVCEETYQEFTKETDEKFITKVKKLISNTWEHLKNKCTHVIKNLWDTVKTNAVGALVSELFNLINDFFLKTAKNILKIIRTMWKSIYNALKVIFSSESSWEERIFEATKILTSGLVGVVGFTLNELIDKALMSIGIPFSSFIAECLSGLFAGIISSVILVVFDSVKGKLFNKSPYLTAKAVETKLVAIDCARISISSLKTDKEVYETYKFVGTTVGEIKKSYDHIAEEEAKGQKLMLEIEVESDGLKESVNRTKTMLDKYGEGNDF